ncbi:DUF3846 domain-containing protein [Amycolatopsis alkalitolerans]|uniref:DUF3846 domain-containing protein n=1 Tax=Amycolatopsis alkalitolerans TaxID=2547244 RepID=UPI001F3AD972|nr:DUF3846 domain-containing protein [Amycolatopsis alkalitolerans]
MIPVDRRNPIHLAQIDEHALDAFRRLVDGDLEVAHLNRPPATLYMNAEGKLLDMPVNGRATALAWTHNSAFRGRDVIAGPAFIVGRPDRRGDDTSAPQDLVDLLFHTRRYRVEVQTAHDRQWSSNARTFEDWLDAYVYGVDLAQRWTAVTEVRVVPVLDEALRESWYRIGIGYRQIAGATDPRFTRDSFTGCYSVEELENWIGHAQWVIGTAFYYRDLCFIQQTKSGDEWLTIRHGIAFESLSLMPHIEDGTFASLVHRLLAASKEQCQRLEY